MISATYASCPPWLNIDISVLWLNRILSAINAAHLKSSFKLKSNFEATITEEALT